LNYLSKVKLLEILYDLDSPSNEGSLLVHENKTGEELLCCDVDCGDHLDLFTVGGEYEAFFSTFGVISRAEKERGPANVEKNQYRGVIRMTGKIVDVRDNWYVCDVGFYVYAMSMTGISDIKKGDRVNITGGLRVDLVVK
jgi:hypothetical protein